MLPAVGEPVGYTAAAGVFVAGLVLELALAFVALGWIVVATRVKFRSAADGYFSQARAHPGARP